MHASVGADEGLGATQGATGDTLTPFGRGHELTLIPGGIRAENGSQRLRISDRPDVPLAPPKETSIRKEQQA